MPVPVRAGPAELSPAAAVLSVAKHQLGRGFKRMALATQPPAGRHPGCVRSSGSRWPAARARSGTSPPHAAPANPSAEGADGRVVLTWGAVTDATRYVILWDDNRPAPTYAMKSADIENTTYTHTGLTTCRLPLPDRRGNERRPRPREPTVFAAPGPVPGRIEWTAVTIQNPGHTIYFSETAHATHYRVYFAGLEIGADRPRPLAPFVEADGSPACARDIPVTSPLYLPRDRNERRADRRRRAGRGLADAVISEQDLGRRASRASPSASRTRTTASTCRPRSAHQHGHLPGSFAARVLDGRGSRGPGRGAGRKVGDLRFADFNGDGFDDMFSKRGRPPATPARSP